METTQSDVFVMFLKDISIPEIDMILYLTSQKWEA